MKDYKELRKAIKNKNAGEDFDEVNKRIENIISPILDKSGKIKIIKSLICLFEGKLNNAAFYSLTTICYTIMIGAVTILCNMEGVPNATIIIMALVLISVAVGLNFKSIKNAFNDSKNTFILKVLYFKLDELYNKSEGSEETGMTDEAVTTNGANTANDPGEEKKNKKYTPYNFDEKLEYKIYDNIGERYKREFMGKKPIINEKKPDFDKYSEWKDYFKNKFSKGFSNKGDFKRYLNRKLRIYQRFREIYISVAIPIYIGIVTTEIELYPTEVYPIPLLVVALVVSAILIMIVSMFFIHKYNTRINFYKDCINIIK